ncbi:MAG: PLP-dependent aminotransferase family protein [Proteobacteria bacterium]|nr:PLP-dependent aminotransferase family protein [Pseudomonadota bacterium]
MHKIANSGCGELASTLKSSGFHSQKDGEIDFIPMSPDPRLLPVEDFRKCVNQVLKKNGSSLLQYGDPLGFPPLREYLSHRMRMHGISVFPDEILITSGIQNGVDLVSRMLMAPGSKIVVENPTYSAILPLFQFHRADIVTVDQTEAGMDLDQLESVLSGEPPVLVYTVPNFQNPTGITTSQSHREKLLRLCEKYRVPLLEDGFEEEMKYFGKTVLPIKSMDQHHIVMYLGTFSKVLFPGLRIAWIAADRACIEVLAAIKKAGDLSGNMMNQAALNLFCRYGFYDLQLKRLHKVYRRRMQTALKAARAFIPRNLASFSKPLGGYCLWFELNHFRGDEPEMMDKMKSHGVLVSPGKSFFAASTDRICFRISIAHRDEKEIEEGIKRIGRALA